MNEGQSSWQYNDFDMEEDEGTGDQGNCVAPFNMGDYGSKMDKMDKMDILI